MINASYPTPGAIPLEFVRQFNLLVSLLRRIAARDRFLANR